MSVKLRHLFMDMTTNMAIDLGLVDSRSKQTYVLLDGQLCGLRSKDLRPFIRRYTFVSESVYTPTCVQTLGAFSAGNKILTEKGLVDEASNGLLSCCEGSDVLTSSVEESSLPILQGGNKTRLSVEDLADICDVATNVVDPIEIFPSIWVEVDPSYRGGYEEVWLACENRMAMVSRVITVPCMRSMEIVENYPQIFTKDVRRAFVKLLKTRLAGVKNKKLYFGRSAGIGTVPNRLVKPDEAVTECMSNGLDARKLASHTFTDYNRSDEQVVVRHGMHYLGLEVLSSMIHAANKGTFERTRVTLF